MDTRLLIPVNIHTRILPEYIIHGCTYPTRNPFNFFFFLYLSPVFHEKPFLLLSSRSVSIICFSIYAWTHLPISRDPVMAQAEITLTIPYQVQHPSSAFLLTDPKPHWPIEPLHTHLSSHCTVQKTKFLSEISSNTFLANPMSSHFA